MKYSIIIIIVLLLIIFFGIVLLSLSSPQQKTSGIFQESAPVKADSLPSMPYGWGLVRINFSPSSMVFLSEHSPVTFSVYDLSDNNLEFSTTQTINMGSQGYMEMIFPAGRYMLTNNIEGYPFVVVKSNGVMAQPEFEIIANKRIDMNVTIKQSGR